MRPTLEKLLFTEKENDPERSIRYRGEDMDIEWVDGSKISVAAEGDEVTISANREGMLSLAKQLEALAKALPGDHIHYDEYNSLEDGSAELVIEIID